MSSIRHCVCSVPSYVSNNIVYTMLLFQVILFIQCYCFKLYCVCYVIVSSYNVYTVLLFQVILCILYNLDEIK